MMSEDLVEAPSEEIFCLLDMAIRKKIFLGHLHFLFFFLCWVFFAHHKQSIDNQTKKRERVKRRASKLFYSVVTLMTNDALLKMKGVIHITMI